MSFLVKKPTDQEIVLGIQSCGTSRNYFENLLYNRFTYLRSSVGSKYHLSEESLSMAYSDTILSVIENIANGKFEGRSGLKTYVYKIFSNKCVDAVRRNTTNRVTGISLDDFIEPIPGVYRSALSDMIRNQDYELLKRKLAEIGSRCKELLTRWSTGYTDQESAVEYNYTSAAVVQVTRLRCLEKLRAMYDGSLK